ncbi:vacuolar protein sorting-associated protein 13B [Nematolebias whitei]|uniref:vacuolar protein sorting-associated protein 13B n=1 Tax=Nematolebias whitei TaxID=451745 RepID=UPI00189BAA21|nr:vacuolar protein sorting-associated protein 13B [Nematolebias whitei]
MNLGILRDPGSEVEDRQYQIDLQSLNIGTAQWEQLKPEKEGVKGGVTAENERSSQNPALEWNMASSIRRHQERRAILTPILTDFSVRVTAAPAIIFSKNLSPDGGQTEEVVVCGHSLEVNVTSSLDFYLSVAQVQLLQQLLRDNMVGQNAPEKSAQARRQEQKCGHQDPATVGDSSSRYSGTGQDSGFGSDSARIRIVQIEQQSGASHHCIARPSRKSTITKNLNFIPFDIFLTASKLSVMTYVCSSTPKALTTLTDTPSTPEKRELGDKVGKSVLNHPEIVSESPPPSTSPTSDQTPVAQSSLAGLTAEDILNSNTSQPASPLLKRSFFSIDGLPTPTRSSARQSLGITIVRQPGRRGAGDQLLEPLLYLQVIQPSILLSCHHRKQRMELSVFDVFLKGVSSNYKCLDPGKTLPEPLDYNVFWLQTVTGEVDSKTGIPPPLLCFQIKDFLNGPAELNVDLFRPLKISPTLAKLEQAKAYLQKVLPASTGDTSSKPPSASSSPQPSPKKTPHRVFPPRSDPHHEASAQSTGSSVRALALSFHKISLHTAQIVVVMETETHPMRPNITVSLSGLTGSLSMKSGPKVEANIHSCHPSHPLVHETSGDLYLVIAAPWPGDKMERGGIKLTHSEARANLKRGTRRAQSDYRRRIDDHLNSNKYRQRLYFLRVLTRNIITQSLLVSFYQCSIESIVTYCINGWYFSCTVAQTKVIQRVINTAPKIVCCPLFSLEGLHSCHCIGKFHNILKDKDF